MCWILPFQFPLVLILVLLSFSDAADGAAPFWLKFQPREDAQYRYYVGRSSPAPSQAEAFKQAYQDAVENAIKENFGYSLEINKSSYQGIAKTNLSEKIQEQFRQVEVHGFELQEQYFTEAKDSTTEAFTLFRYSKREIEKERDRLARAKDGAPIRSFSELKAGNGAAGLTVITKPSNAAIFIDGESYGKTDARIRNLSVGQHSLKIEHENYEPVEETVNLTPGAELRVEEHLQLSKGQLRIESSLPNALITVNGKIVGTTPTELISVNAGEQIQIRAEHPEAELMLQAIEVSRNEKREVMLHLQPKPSYLSITTKPGGSTLLMNDKELGKTDAFGNGKFPVPAGSLEIVVKKDGFQDETLNKEIRGGQTLRVAETVTLTSLAELKAIQDRAEKEANDRAERRRQEKSAKERRERDEAAEYAANKPWRLLIGLGGSGNPVANTNPESGFHCCGLLDLGLERHLGSWMAARVFYSYKGGSTSTTETGPTRGTPNSTRDVVVSSSSNEVGAALFILPVQNILVGAEYGSSSTKLGFKTSRFNNTGIAQTPTTRNDQFSQFFYGASIGYESTVTEKVGGYVDLGVRKYQEARIYKGNTVLQIKGGVLVGF